ARPPSAAGGVSGPNWRHESSGIVPATCPPEPSGTKGSPLIASHETLTGPSSFSGFRASHHAQSIGAETGPDESTYSAAKCTPDFGGASAGSAFTARMRGEVTTDTVSFRAGLHAAATAIAPAIPKAIALRLTTTTSLQRPEESAAR